MKKIFLLIVITTWLSQCYAQQSQDKPFDSVFKNMRSGHLSGTANGVLFVKQNNDELVLDFQGTEADLSVTADPEEMYDISVKAYSSHTTSGKTSVTYSTYNMANRLEIRLNGIIYSLNFIDGAAHETISGLSYYYKSEKGTEYLVLQVEKEIILSNFYSLITASAKNNPDPETIKKQEQKLVLLPHSTLTFAIRR